MSSIRPAPEVRPPDMVMAYTGQVVYMFAFDIAYDMTRHPIDRLLGLPVSQYQMDASKRIPRQLVFYRPQMVRLPATDRNTSAGVVRVEQQVKILPVGAISIAVRVPFRVERIEQLVPFHDLQLDGRPLVAEVRQLAEEIRRELSDSAIRPVERLSEEEGYPVFCIESPPALRDGAHFSAEEWLLTNRRAVASLLTQEPDLAHLSEQEVTESTGRYLSHYDHDLVVLDWDAALIIDEPQYFDETLYVIELANLQLAELGAYDRLLDDAVDRSYRDLERPGLRGRSDVLQRLREIRIDLARLSDELSNITKFFGDWHLARIYQNLSARFHLADWHHTIDEKLRTLDGLYLLHKQDQNNRAMLLLEITIVLLFIIDLVILFAGLKSGTPG